MNSKYFYDISYKFTVEPREARKFPNRDFQPLDRREHKEFAKKLNNLAKKNFHSGYFGTFNKYDNKDLIPKQLNTKNSTLKDFHNTEGIWINGYAEHMIKSSSETAKEISKNFHFVASISGTTLTMLFNFVHIKRFEIFMQKSDNVTEIKIDKKQLMKELFDISLLICSWLGLAGHHSLGEIVAAYIYVAQYCETNLEENGNLKVIDTEEKIKLMKSIVNDKNLIKDYFDKTYETYPSIIYNYKNELESYADQLNEINKKTSIQQNNYNYF